MLLCWISVLLLFSTIFNGQYSEAIRQKPKQTSLNQPRQYRWILNRPQCIDPKRSKQVDRNIEKLIGIGKKGRKFPESFSQVKPFCK